jgi:hypothetical protein
MGAQLATASIAAADPPKSGDATVWGPSPSVVGEETSSTLSACYPQDPGFTAVFWAETPAGEEINLGSIYVPADHENLCRFATLYWTPEEEGNYIVHVDIYFDDEGSDHVGAYVHTVMIED